MGDETRFIRVLKAVESLLAGTRDPTSNQENRETTFSEKHFPYRKSIHRYRKGNRANPKTAMDVASWIWDVIKGEEIGALLVKIQKALGETVPDIPAWALESRQDFRNWFRALAEDHNKAGGKLLPEAITWRECPYSASRLQVTGSQFKGRDAEMEALNAAWKNPSCRIVQVVAQGGEGKTALVAQWRNQLNANGWRGSKCAFDWSFHSQGGGCRRAVSTDQFFDAILRWLGEKEPERWQGAAKGAHTAALLSERRALLILDGLEPFQLLSKMPVGGNFTDLALESLLCNLTTAKSGRCIITTRLAVSELAPYEGVGTVRTLALRGLDSAAGVSLLRSLGVKGAEPELTKVVEEVNGHALTLNLIGNYLRHAKSNNPDINCWHEIRWEEADKLQGGQAYRILGAYDRWLLRDAPEMLAVLRILGLFDHPAEAGCLDVLRRRLIPRLTEPLTRQSDDQWNITLTRLSEELHLITRTEDGGIDSHPLLREYFAARLKKENADAWRQANTLLYEHLKETPDALEGAETSERIQVLRPLFQAVAYGCRAGLYPKVFDEVYWPRIQREKVGYSHRLLGQFADDLQALSEFYETPWSTPVPTLSPRTQALLFGLTGSRLRALGRFQDAIEPTRQALQAYEQSSEWQWAARQARHLCEIYFAEGELKKAMHYAETAVNHAEQSQDDYEKYVEKAVRAAMLHHHSGSTEETRAGFKEAEQNLKDSPARGMNRLYSLWGFRYCEFLLDEGNVADVLERSDRVAEFRALRLPEADPEAGLGLVGIALERLWWVKARLLDLMHRRGPLKEMAALEGDINQAVELVDNAGRQDFRPLGYFVKAALYRAIGESSVRPSAFWKRAAESLRIALEICERRSMKFYLADTHLEWARLRLAECKSILRRQHGTRRMPDSARKAREDAEGHWTKAKKIIDEIHYGRRFQELGDIGSQLGESARNSGNLKR